MSATLEAVTVESGFTEGEIYLPRVITSELQIQSTFSHHLIPFTADSDSLTYEALHHYYWWVGTPPPPPTNLGDRSLEDYYDVYKNVGSTPEHFGQMYAAIRNKGRVKKTFLQWQEERLLMIPSEGQEKRVAPNPRVQSNPVYITEDPAPTLLLAPLFSNEIIKDPRGGSLAIEIEGDAAFIEAVMRTLGLTEAVKP